MGIDRTVDKSSARLLLTLSAFVNHESNDATEITASRGGDRFKTVGESCSARPDKIPRLGATNVNPGTQMSCHAPCEVELHYYLKWNYFFCGGRFSKLVDLPQSTDLLQPQPTNCKGTWDWRDVLYDAK